MLKINKIDDRTLSIVAPGKITSEVIDEVVSQIDNLTKGCSRIRLLIDVSECNGWDSSSTFRKHISASKAMRHSVDKIAVNTGQLWQKILIKSLTLFVKIHVKIFGAREKEEARSWIIN